MFICTKAVNTFPRNNLIINNRRNIKNNIIFRFFGLRGPGRLHYFPFDFLCVISFSYDHLISYNVIIKNSCVSTFNYFVLNLLDNLIK